MNMLPKSQHPRTATVLLPCGHTVTVRNREQRCCECGALVWIVYDRRRDDTTPWIEVDPSYPPGLPVLLSVVVQP